MRNSILAIPVALLAILAPAALMATDITYNVDESVGAGSVTGSITTDGSLGVLGTSDILSWNLVLNDGTNPTFDIDGSNSVEGVSGSYLTATAAQLLFDYSGPGAGGYFILEGSSNGPFVCYATFNCYSGYAGSGVYLATEDADVTTGDYPDLVSTALSDDGVIGSTSVAPVSPVPEPDSLFLLGSGLMGFAGLGWRRLAWRRAG